MIIKTLNINEIKPYWRNPRNNLAGVEAVKQSIRNYGFNQPIVIDNNNVIVAGHTRYKASLELGHLTIDCVIVDLTPEKIKEYRIADNKASEFATWDMQLLIPELREMESLGDMQIFFPKIDLDALILSASSIIPITQEQIDKRQGVLTNTYENIVDRANNSMVEIACPDCGTAFFIDAHSAVARTVIQGKNEMLDLELELEQKQDQIKIESKINERNNQRTSA